VDTCVVSSCAMLVMTLVQGRWTEPSRHTCSPLACGWALTTGRHTMTTSVWWTGAAMVTHCSRFYVFLGGPFDQARGREWAGIIRHAAQLVPADTPMVVELDDTTKKKARIHIEGADRYRHGAGSARQEYRTLWGLNVVLGVMRVPLRWWPGHAVTIPIGLELSLKEAQALPRHVPSRPRSQLARRILDAVVAQLPGHQIRVLADGGDATQDFLRDLPTGAEVSSRFLISGKRYALPTPPAPGPAPSERAAAGLPQNLCAAAPRLAPPSHGRRNHGPKLDRPVAHGAARPTGTGRGGPSHSWSAGQVSGPTQAPAPRRGVLHHSSRPHPGGGVATVSGPLGHRDQTSGRQCL
jgi:hypothetical protein